MALTREQLEEGNDRSWQVDHLTNRARVLARADKLEDAVAYYGQALQLNPSYLPALLGGSEALTRLQQYGPAAQALDKAMKIDPRVEPSDSQQHSPGALITMAAVKGSRQDYAAAERLLLGALERYPQSWQAYKYLGFVRANQNLFDDAVTSYRNAIRINPQAVTVYELLGRLYARHGQIPEAIEMVEKALEIDSNQPQLRQFLSDMRSRRACRL